MQPQMPEEYKGDPIQTAAWQFGLEAFDWDEHSDELLAFAKEHTALHALITFDNAGPGGRSFPPGLYVCCPTDLGADGRIGVARLYFPLERPDLDSNREAKRIAIKTLLCQFGLALQTVGCEACFSTRVFSERLSDHGYWVQLEQRRLMAALEADRLAREKDQGPAAAARSARRSSMRL